ncbi:MAG TPA: translation initiation factor IF-3 [Blastocatellia bacterium]|nr:translation initiation factor IF-3 [Blastocatellia bacterium]
MRERKEDAISRPSYRRSDFRRDHRSPYRVNERIRAEQVRVIDENGQQIGILPLREALALARQRDLDLVEVAPQADPPVCRITDYGKYLYEQKKKAQEAKKKQTVITVKEIKFRPATDHHDYEFKMKNAQRILSEGDKVKATVHFRGREVVHKELGENLLRRLMADLAEVAVVESALRMEGPNMSVVFAPKKREVARQGAPSERPNP